MNEKRRQSFRVTHLFSPYSVETKPRQGAVLGPSSGPMASGTALVLTLTTVPSVLLNPQLAWLLPSVWPQHVWISHKTERHAVPWPLLKYPCVPAYCLPQHGPGGGRTRRRGHLDKGVGGGKHGNQETRLGNWELLQCQKWREERTCSQQVWQKAAIRLRYLSVSSRARTASPPLMSPLQHLHFYH